MNWNYYFSETAAACLCASELPGLPITYAALENKLCSWNQTVSVSPYTQLPIPGEFYF